MTARVASASATVGKAAGPAAGARVGPAVVCRNLVHVYGGVAGTGPGVGSEVAALRGVELEVPRGETLAVLGPSGAGKSTLLWLLAGLTRPTAGEVQVDGVDLGPLTPAQLRAVRAHRVGVLLQNPSRNLLSYATCLDNVRFAQTRRRGPGRWGLSRAAARDAAQDAADLLAAVGLADRRHARAGSLSGGEQQRLALTVAVANGPAVLLADEPTSQLDAASAALVVDLMRATAADAGTTVVVVTHDPDVAAAMSRTVTISDGRIGRQTRAGHDHVVVGPDGQVHLPPAVLGVLPPGTVLAVDLLADGVQLRRDAGSGSGNDAATGPDTRPDNRPDNRPDGEEAT